MKGIKMRSIRARWTAAALASALLLGACSNGSEDETGDDGQAAEPEGDGAEGTDGDTEEADGGTDGTDAAMELEEVGPVSMGLIGIPNIFAMVMPAVADEEGFYDKYKVTVEPRDMETGVDAARAVQGGDLDMAWSPTGPVMTFAATGVDVTAIQGMEVVDWVVASINPDVQECEDLEGEAVAIDSIGGARYSVLEIILDSCGLTIEDLADTPALPGPAAVQAMIAGQVDTTVMHLDDLAAARKESGDDLTIIERLVDVSDDQHYLVGWALADTVEEKREALVRILAANIEAVRFMNDPANEERVFEIAQVTGVAEDVIESAMTDLLELGFWTVDGHGLPEDKIEATIEEQVQLGNIEQASAPSPSDVIDTSLYEEALELVESMGGA